MSEDEKSPITARQAKNLFADWKGAPALVLAVSGGPDSIALMWLMARWRRTLSRGPRLLAVTVDHGLRAESAREAPRSAQTAPIASASLLGIPEEEFTPSVREAAGRLVDEIER